MHYRLLSVVLLACAALPSLAAPRPGFILTEHQPVPKTKDGVLTPEGYQLLGRNIYWYTPAPGSRAKPSEFERDAEALDRWLAKMHSHETDPDRPILDSPTVANRIKQFTDRYPGRVTIKPWYL